MFDVNTTKAALSYLAASNATAISIAGAGLS
jgi:hypothetical protein